MQSLETKSSRPRLKSFETETRPETFETETPKNDSRDASRDRDQVSRLHHCWQYWSLYGVPVRVSSTLICRLFVFVQLKFLAMSLLTKHSAEELVYLRKYVKYGAAQRVEMR